MCSPMAGAGLGALGGFMSAKAQAQAEADQINAQRQTQREMYREANINNAQANLSLADKAEQTRQQITQVNMQALRNEGTINAAIGESMLSGNTVNRLRQAVRNEASQQVVALTDNYHRDYQSIFANEVNNVESTKSAIKGMPKIRQTSKAALALGVVSSAASGYSTGASIQQSYKQSKGG